MTRLTDGMIGTTALFDGVRPDLLLLFQLLLDQIRAEGDVIVSARIGDRLARIGTKRDVLTLHLSEGPVPIAAFRGLARPTPSTLRRLDDPGYRPDPDDARDPDATKPTAAFDPRTQALVRRAMRHSAALAVLINARDHGLNGERRAALWDRARCAVTMAAEVERPGALILHPQALLLETAEFLNHPDAAWQDGPVDSCPISARLLTPPRRDPRPLPVVPDRPRPRTQLRSAGRLIALNAQSTPCQTPPVLPHAATQVRRMVQAMRGDPLPTPPRPRVSVWARRAVVAQWMGWALSWSLGAAPLLTG